MYEVKVITQFAAAHQLRNFKGKCEELHGHNWKVEVSLAGTTLNAAGLLIDFQEVKEATGRILSELDHSFLNEIPYFKERNPSSENIAAYLFDKLSNEFDGDMVTVVQVTAWESDSACASYRA
jgi:6-pyruvoyltetrahydropterin/6-carboxytetrahydropterin synthase